MENGWAKFKAHNSGTSDTIYNFIINKAALDIKANTQYTLVLEFRNLININSTAYFNPIGDDSNASLFTSVKNMQINTITEGMHKYLITSKSDISQSTQASYLYLQPGERCEFECRMSILEGNYINTDYVYELYGIAPTPDYPVEIKSIGYENL